MEYPGRHELKLSSAIRPIARTPLLVCYGNNDDLCLVLSVEYIERESLENELAGSVLGHGITSRSFYDLGDGIVNSMCEGCST